MNTKTLLSATMLAGATFFLAGCPGESTKKAVGKVTETVVENVKGAASGVSEGFESGRKQVTSADGAIVLGTAGEMEGKLVPEIVNVENHGDRTVVTLGFANDTGQTYRVTNLKDSVVLLDKSGYVTRVTGDIIADVTVPSKAKDKIELTFSGSADKFAKIRIFGRDQALPAATPAAE